MCTSWWVVLRRKRLGFSLICQHDTLLCFFFLISSVALPVYFFFNFPLSVCLFMNRFAGVIRQVCHLSRGGLTFTLWYLVFYKMRKNLTPSYLSSLMPSPSSTSGYQFRREPYPVPAVSKISSLASFIPRAIILWNTLPSSVQSAKTVSQFKCNYTCTIKIFFIFSFLSLLFSLFFFFSQVIQSGAWLW